MQIVDCARTKPSTEVEIECNKNDGGATECIQLWLNHPTLTRYSDTSDAIAACAVDFTHTTNIPNVKWHDICIHWPLILFCWLFIKLNFICIYFAESISADERMNEFYRVFKPETYLLFTIRPNYRNREKFILF